MRLRPALPLALLLLLGACAVAPTFETGGIDLSLKPRAVADQPQRFMGRQVLWGGIILRTTNLPDRGRIEVLAFPLDADARPRQEDQAEGRFILEQAGYLDPASHAEGRQISVTGTVSGTWSGQAGEAAYVYPVISARQLHLWPLRRNVIRIGGYVGFGTGDEDSTDSEIGIGF